MAMIFPGMDPYLENPDFWPGVHNHLVVYLAEQLQPRLRRRYIAAVQERVFVEELEIHESFIEILELPSGKRVVTVIEAISPTNKVAGPGRESYQAKQREVLRSTAHFVEIDLLRQGQHVLAVPERLVRGRLAYQYLVCVNRERRCRNRCECYAWGLRDRLPRVGIPLADEDPDVPLDLQEALSRVYELGSYRDRIDYSSPCRPPVSEEDQAWANELVKQASLSG